MDINEKYKRLKEILRSYKKAAVAFSGGVDSTFLAKVCHDELGENCAAVTLVSSMNPKSEMKAAGEIAKKIGVRHYILKDSLLEEAVSMNTPERCYHCKKIEFSKIKKKASGLGIDIVLDGSNQDDLSDYRPGLRALRETGIKSPLREAGLTKDEIRLLSKKLGLPTWNKPAFACLASRIPYGERITGEKLERVEKAEDFLRKLGFIQFRVRSHQDMARIEISPGERVKMLDINLMDRVSKKLKSFGFVYVAMELEGYSMGSLNRVIQNKRKAK